MRITDEATMSFGDHLEELRSRIILGGIVVLPLAALTFFLSDTLIQWLVLPLRGVLEAHGRPTELQALSPPEFLITQLKLSIITGVILAAPWLIWQVWLFIRPGLYASERRFVHFLVPGSTILTASGISLMYFLMLPLMLSVLVAVGQGIPAGETSPAIDAVIAARPPVEIVTRLPEAAVEGGAWLVVPEMRLHVGVAGADGPLYALVPPPRPLVTSTFRLSEYINFVLLLFLGIVIAFQMPLVVTLLGWIGIVTPEWLARHRRHALLVCGIVAAMITPADIVSMLAMLGPLYGLYELGILMLKVAPASRVAEGTVLSQLSPGRRKTAARTPPPGTRSRDTEPDGDADDDRGDA